MTERNNPEHDGGMKRQSMTKKNDKNGTTVYR